MLTKKQKVIFHLEAFVAKFMRILEGYRKLVIILNLNHRLTKVN